MSGTNDKEKAGPREAGFISKVTFRGQRLELPAINAGLLTMEASKDTQACGFTYDCRIRY